MDYQGYRCLAGIALLGSLVAVDSKDKLDSFRCSTADICNRDGKPQFCAAAEKRCLNCEDYASRCGTWQMSTNCSEFCWQFKMNKFLDRTCSSPWNISNGQVDVSPTIYGRHLPGTTLTIVCDEGFEIRGNTNFTCNEQGQWTPDSTTAYCIQVPTSSPLAFILVSVIVVVSVAFSASCFVIIYLWKKGKRTSVKSATYQVPPSNGPVDEETPIMEDLNVGVDNNESEQIIGNGNGQQFVLNAITMVGQRVDDTNSDERDTNNGDVNADNTNVRTGEGETCKPEEPSNVSTDSSFPDQSPNNEETSTKYPIQVETTDAIKENGLIEVLPRSDHVCQESGEGNDKKKFAFGENTVDNGDLANTYWRNGENLVHS